MECAKLVPCHIKMQCISLLTCVALSKVLLLCFLLNPVCLVLNTGDFTREVINITVLMPSHADKNVAQGALFPS